MSRYFFLVPVLCLSVPAPGCKPAALTPPAPKAPFSMKDVELDSPGGLCRGKFGAPSLEGADQAKLPALLLIHEDHGLTDWEVEQARNLVEDGYCVFAVDLYGGQKVDTVMDAHIMSRGLPDDLVLTKLKTAVDFLAAQPHVRSDRIGVIGWDIGGGYALDAARNDPRLKACIDCYGRVVTEAALLAPLRAAVLGIFAGKDVGISDETLSAFRKCLQQSGKKHEIKVFPKSNHGFMNPASPEGEGKPDPQAAQEAWDAIRTFLAAELKQP